jgi:hypothetical protein
MKRMRALMRALSLYRESASVAAVATRQSVSSTIQ